ncbi:MAG: hypothetical protein [Bacteriophage sp.]|nr:MAG: hypothetical protein [Bacteriophage sp.]
MKFLDLNGLKHLLKFMDRTVSVASSKCQVNSQNGRDIPFITNHQIINMDISSNINIFNWFKGASEGGILEIVSAGAQGGNTLGINDTNTSIIYKMEIERGGPVLNKLDYLPIAYNTYARLIKLDGKLIVAEFVQNK